MIDPHKKKYHKFYWRVAEAAAKETIATKYQVGAVVVTPTGMLSTGWNGMPAGFPNNCEHFVKNADNLDEWKTKPEVIHAERNAIDKMTNQGIPVAGSILFTTLSPCWECAKSLLGLDLKAIYYDKTHDNGEGLELLKQASIPIYRKQ